MKTILAGGILCLVIHGVLLASSAAGGSFSTVPVRVFFERNARSAALKVVNTGDQKLVLQLRAVRWHQDRDGSDRNDATNDIVFFPRMAQVEPGGTQVIRIGYEGSPPDPVERTYRLYLEELPVPAPGETAVRIAVRMSVPIFIRVREAGRLWTIERFDLTGGTLSARIRNGGNAHFIVSSIKTSGFDASGAETFSRKVPGWYVLPGASRMHVLGISREECMNAATLRVEAEVDGSVAAASLNVDRGMCPKEGEAPPRPDLRRIPEDGADGG